MKKNRFLTLLIAASLSLVMVAQDLNDACAKAQKSLIEYLRSSGISASVDPEDNSVCFRLKGQESLYWITFEGEGPVLYTIHRKGIKFDKDTTFVPACARIACNEVNKKHNIKCVYDNKRVEFLMQTFAKDPSDFHGGLKEMLKSFKDVDETFKSEYEKAHKKWLEEKEKVNQPDPLPAPKLGHSPLEISRISFANFDMAGNMISDYDEPLRKSNCRCVKTKVNVASKEKGLFKLGIKIYNPDNKPMVLSKGNEYAATQNIEIKKTGKPIPIELPSYGSDREDFWKAGEYRVEIYDFETGVLIASETFNLL